MKSRLKITFVMPRTGEWASGGLRIVYQYANHLSKRGHSVTVVHPGRYVINPTLSDHARNAIQYVLRKCDGLYTPKTWLTMDSSVRMTCVPSFSERYIPDGDIVIATAWQTADWVSHYSSSKGRGFYFIQHLETWNGPEPSVLATWKLPLQKIVPSRWLLEFARSLGEEATYLPSGLDMDTFKLSTAYECRSPKQLLMLYHTAEWKGCGDGLEALAHVRKKHPDIRASLFGVPERPATLPKWIDYHHKPSPELLVGLYNKAAIFVAPSRTEGWGLTGCEALLCGAALVATDIDGHREFAFHEQTALTSPARSPIFLADNVVRLIEDADLRVRLARGGYEFVRQLTWERATSGFEEALSDEILSNRRA